MTGPRQTVANFLTHWLEETHKRTIRIHTYHNYQDLLRLHILPVIGHHQLQKLSPQHLETLYAKKLDEGLSEGVVQIMHAMLHKALDTAVLWNILPFNVCDKVTAPRQRRHEMQTLTPEQAQQFLQAAQEHRLKALFVLALATGMRKGEIAGLKWQDISMTYGTLHVRRTISYINKIGIIESEPKTEQGRRSIVLPAFAMEALKEHRLLQLEEQLRAGELWQDHDLVFSTATGDYINPTSTLLKIFKTILKKAGLPDMRFHDLRHSAATLLLSMGVHAKVIQELLGHSQISITMNIYGHVLPSMQQDAMEKMNSLLQKKE
jgi:integrase